MALIYTREETETEVTITFPHEEAWVGLYIGLTVCLILGVWFFADKTMLMIGLVINFAYVFVRIIGGFRAEREVKQAVERYGLVSPAGRPSLFPNYQMIIPKTAEQQVEKRYID